MAHFSKRKSSIFLALDLIEICAKLYRFLKDVSQKTLDDSAVECAATYFDFDF